MKKIKYIIAACAAAFALSTSAFAVGDVVDGIENGAEDIIDGAGDAADDIIGDGSDAENGTGDVTNAIGTDDTADTSTAAATTVTETTTAAAVTTEAVTTVPEVTTGAAGNVGGDNNVNTGFILTFTAMGAAAAGLTAVAARKRK